MADELTQEQLAEADEYYAHLATLHPRLRCDCKTCLTPPSMREPCAECGGDHCDHWCCCGRDPDKQRRCGECRHCHGFVGIGERRCHSDEHKAPCTFLTSVACPHFEEKENPDA